MNGCSYANQVLYRRARALGHPFLVIDTNMAATISGDHGQMFSMRKLLSFLRTYRHLPSMVRADVAYMTPGQTLYGVLKYAPFIALSRLLGIPYVIHLHGNHLGAHFSKLRGIKRSLFRGCISGAAAAIVLSESLRENFSGLLPPERIHVVENFAGDELFAAPRQEKDRSQMKLLYLSNLMREKGILELLDSLCELKGKGVQFSAHIAGRLEEGIRTDVEGRLEKLRPEVTYVGPVSGQQKIDLLNQCNVLALPTYYSMEGQPIALLEGLASGNILVTTRHAGIPDIIDHTNGYLLPTRDVEALTRCLEHVAKNLDDEMQRVSSNNIQKATTRFTEAAFSGAIIDLLRTVAHPRSRKAAPCKS